MTQIKFIKIIKEINKNSKDVNIDPNELEKQRKSQQDWVQQLAAIPAQKTNKQFTLNVGHKSLPQSQLSTQAAVESDIEQDKNAALRKRETDKKQGKLSFLEPELPIDSQNNTNNDPDIKVQSSNEIPLQAKFKSEKPSGESFDYAQWSDHIPTTQEVKEIFAKYAKINPQLEIQKVIQSISPEEKNNSQTLFVKFSDAGLKDYANVQMYFLSSDSEFAILAQKEYSIRKEKQKNPDLELSSEDEFVVQEVKNLKDNLKEFGHYALPLFNAYQKMTLGLQKTQIEPVQKATSTETALEYELRKKWKLKLKDLNLQGSIFKAPEVKKYITLREEHMLGLLQKEFAIAYKELKRPEILNVFIEAMNILLDPNTVVVGKGVNQLEDLSSADAILFSKVWKEKVLNYLHAHLKGKLHAKNPDGSQYKLKRVHALISFMINDLGADSEKIIEFFTKSKPSVVVEKLLNSEWVNELERVYSTTDSHFINLKDELYRKEEVYNEIKNISIENELLSQEQNIPKEDVPGTLDFFKKHIFDSQAVEMKLQPLQDLKEELEDIINDPNERGNDELRLQIQKEIEELIPDLKDSFAILARQIFNDIARSRGLDEKVDLMARLEWALAKGIRKYNNKTDGNFIDYLATFLRNESELALRKFNVGNSRIAALPVEDKGFGQLLDLFNDVVDIHKVPRYVGMEYKNEPHTPENADVSQELIGNPLLALYKKRFQKPVFKVRKTYAVQHEPVLKGTAIRNPDIASQYIINLFNEFEKSTNADDLFMPLSQLLNLTHFTTEAKEMPNITSKLGTKSSYSAILDYMYKTGFNLHTLKPGQKGPDARNASVQGFDSEGNSLIRPLGYKKAPDPIKPYLAEFVFALFDGNLRDAKLALEGRTQKGPRTNLKFNQIIPELAEIVIESLKDDVMKAASAAEQITQDKFLKKKQIEKDKRQTQRQILQKKWSKALDSIIKIQKKYDIDPTEKDELLQAAEDKRQNIEMAMDKLNKSVLAKEPNDFSKNRAFKKALSQQLTNKAQLGPLALSTEESPVRLMETIKKNILQALIPAVYSARPKNQQSIGSTTYLEDEELKHVEEKINNLLKIEAKPADRDIQQILQPFFNARRLYNGFLKNALDTNEWKSKDLQAIAEKSMWDEVMKYCWERQNGMFTGGHPQQLMRVLFNRIDNAIKRALHDKASSRRFGNTNLSIGTMKDVWKAIKVVVRKSGKKHLLDYEKDPTEIYQSLIADKDLFGKITDILDKKITRYLQSKIILVKDENKRSNNSLENVKDKKKKTEEELQRLKKQIVQLKPENFSSRNQYTVKLSEIETKIENLERQLAIREPKGNEKLYATEEQFKKAVESFKKNYLNAIPTWIAVERVYNTVNNTNTEKGEWEESLEDQYINIQGAAFSGLQGLQKYLLYHTFSPIRDEHETLSAKLREKQNELKTISKGSFEEKDLLREIEFLKTQLQTTPKSEYDPEMEGVNMVLANARKRIQNAIIRVREHSKTLSIEQQMDQIRQKLDFSKNDKEKEFLKKDLTKLTKKLKNKTLDLRTIIDAEQLLQQIRGDAKVLAKSKNSTKIFEFKYFEFYYILTKMMGTAIMAIAESDKAEKIAETLQDLLDSGILFIYINPSVFSEQFLKATPREMLRFTDLTTLNSSDLIDLINYLENGHSLDPFHEHAETRQERSADSYRRIKAIEKAKQNDWFKKTGDERYNPKLPTMADLAKLGITLDNVDNSETEGKTVGFDAQGRTSSTGNRVEMGIFKKLESEQFKKLGIKSPFKLVSEFIEAKRKDIDLPAYDKEKVAKKDEIRNKEWIENQDDTVAAMEKLSGLSEEERQNQIELADFKKSSSKLKSFEGLVSLLNQLLEDKEEIIDENTGRIYIAKAKVLLQRFAKNDKILSSENRPLIMPTIDSALSKINVKRETYIRTAKSVKNALKSVKNELKNAGLIVKDKEKIVQSAIDRRIQELEDEIKRSSNPKEIRLLKAKLARKKQERFALRKTNVSLGKKGFNILNTKLAEKEKTKKEPSSEAAKILAKSKAKKVQKESILYEFHDLEQSEHPEQNPFKKIIDIIENGLLPDGSLQVSSIFLKKFIPEKFRQLESLKNSCRSTIGRSNRVFQIGLYRIYINDGFEQYIIEKPDLELKGESINFFIPKSSPTYLKRR